MKSSRRSINLFPLNLIWNVHSVRNNITLPFYHWVGPRLPVLRLPQIAWIIDSLDDQKIIWFNTRFSWTIVQGSDGIFKAMLHEAIFLATCLATMTTKKHCRLQRGCHTFAIFFRNLQRPHWKLFTTRSPSAWNLLRAKDGLWLPNFQKIALQVAMDMSHAATCLAMLRKVESSGELNFLRGYRKFR